MNRKIAMSGVSIFATLGLAGVAAFAAFTSSATATGNTLSTGTDQLQIAQNGAGPSASPSPSTFGSSIPGFSGGPIAPGFNQDYILGFKF